MSTAEKPVVANVKVLDFEVRRTLHNPAPIPTKTC